MNSQGCNILYLKSEKHKMEFSSRVPLAEYRNSVDKIKLLNEIPLNTQIYMESVTDLKQWVISLLESSPEN
jgi:hypothetical protein